jgi:hypothetical protein
MERPLVLAFLALSVPEQAGGLRHTESHLIFVAE